MQTPSNTSLEARLFSIGFRIGFEGDALSGTPKQWLALADIEQTLLEVTAQAQKDYRLLSVLMTWIQIHGEQVIVEKLFKRAKKLDPLAGAYAPEILNGMAVWATVCKMEKWKKCISGDPKHTYLIDEEITHSFEAYSGLKPEWLKYGVKVPEKMIRIRASDVLSPLELASTHHQYRNRLIYGASWRADIITAIQAGYRSPTEIARSIGCSYEPAYRVLKDYSIAEQAMSVLPDAAA